MTASDQARTTADALDSAMLRLATTLDRVDELDEEARAVGSSRRDVIMALLGNIDRACASMHPRRSDDGRAPADPADARAVAIGDGSVASHAVGTRRCRVAEAFEQGLERASGDDARLVDLVDELDALLARVELAHVALDLDYDLLDLPPASVAACARVSDAFERTRLPGEPRIRPTARRRGGIASPRGRGSS